MNEENNLNQTNETLENVEQSVETAPVQPVESTPLAEAIVETPKEEKKSNKAVIIIALVIVLLAGVGFAVWKFLLPTLNKENKETTTTTTTTTETTTSAVANLDIEKNNDGVLMFNNILEYTKYTEKYRRNSVNYGMVDETNYILNDNSFYYLDYDINNKCKNENDKVSFKIRDLTVDYTCTNPEDIGDGYKYWDAVVHVNNTFIDEITTLQRCDHNRRYSNGKYIIADYSTCSYDIPNSFSVYSLNNNEVLVGRFYVYYIKDDKAFKNDIFHKSQAIFEKNIMYYVDPIEVKEGMTTCNIKYIDFNKNIIEAKDLTEPEPCYGPAEP